MDNLRYRIRWLTQKDTSSWSNLLDINEYRYQDLAPQVAYTFEVIVEKNGLRSEPARAHFKIKLPWFRSYWFWLGLIILLGSMVLFIFIREQQIFEKDIAIEREITKTAQLKQEKDQLKVEAIVNQLNPHYINNVMQWLQIRFDKLGDEEGVKVIGKLSWNIRTVFKYSRAKKTLSFHTRRNEHSAKLFVYYEKKNGRQTQISNSGAGGFKTFKSSQYPVINDTNPCRKRR